MYMIIAHNEIIMLQAGYRNLLEKKIDVLYKRILTQEIYPKPNLRFQVNIV